MITSEQKAEFFENGVLHIPGFYDVEKDLLPVMQGVYELIGLMLAENNIACARKPFSLAAFDSGIQALITHDRRLVGHLYDAIKQIPAFNRIVAMKAHEKFFSCMHDASLPLVHFAGQGIRIDIPSEEQFGAPWHQEYPYNFKSMRGMIFWAPMVDVDSKMGPLNLCVGSHKEGVWPLEETQDKNIYPYRLKNASEIIKRYPLSVPLVNVGDLVVVDWLTLHRSGANVSDRVRWTLQMRLFDAREEWGRKNHWPGRTANNPDPRKLRADLFENTGGQKVFHA